MRFDVKVFVSCMNDDGSRLRQTNEVLARIGTEPLSSNGIWEFTFRFDDPVWRRLSAELQRVGSFLRSEFVPVIARGEVGRAALLQLVIEAWAGPGLEFPTPSSDTPSPLPRIDPADVARRNLTSTYSRQIVVSDRVIRALEAEHCTGWQATELALVSNSGRQSAGKSSYFWLTATNRLPAIDDATRLEIEHVGEIQIPGYDPPSWILDQVGQSYAVQVGPLIYRESELQAICDFNASHEEWLLAPLTHRAMIITQRAWRILQAFRNRDVQVWPVVVQS